MQSKLHTSVVSGISNLDTAAWDALVPRDEPQLRSELLRAVEKSGQGAGAHYIAVREGGPGGRMLAVAVTHAVDVDLLTLASPKLHKVAAKIRRGPFKRLLILRSVTSGPFITNCRPNLYADPNLPYPLLREAASALIQALDAIPGAGLRLLFELPESMVSIFGPALEEQGYFQARSLPGTHLDIRWDDFDAYIADMRKFYRRAIRHDQAAAVELEFELLEDFSHLADEVHRLYMNVLERAQTTFGCLTRDFFEEFGRCSQSRVVTARERSTGRLVGIEVLLLGDHLIQDLYTGVDYEFNERYHTYFNLIYPGIALACNRVARLSTGQTSYAFKSRLGVQPFPLYLYAKHRFSPLHAVLRRFKDLLCPQVETFTHRVFHDQAGTTAAPREPIAVAAVPAPMLPLLGPPAVTVSPVDLATV